VPGAVLGKDARAFHAAALSGAGTNRVLVCPSALIAMAVIHGENGWKLRQVNARAEALNKTGLIDQMSKAQVNMRPSGRDRQGP
jgi:hypothetical protein